MSATADSGLSVGDMVKHGPGGIVVQLVGIDAAKSVASCRWFGPKGGEKRGQFPLHELVKVQRRPAIRPYFL